MSDKPHPNATMSFSLQKTETHDTLMFAGRLQRDLISLAQAIAVGYQTAGVVASDQVQQGLMQIMLLAGGNAKMGTVLNPPILELTTLVHTARNEINRIAPSVSVNKPTVERGIHALAAKPVSEAGAAAGEIGVVETVGVQIPNVMTNVIDSTSRFNARRKNSAAPVGLDGPVSA